MSECDEECRANRAHREAQIAGELDSTRGSRAAFKAERDALLVQLTEARRMLESALPHVGRVWHGPDAPPVAYIEELRAQITAVLAQEVTP